MKSHALAATLILAGNALAQTSVDLESIEITTLKDQDRISAENVPHLGVGGDSARLLNSSPVVNLQAAGGISSLPSIHGMSSDRVNIKIDQAQVSSSCPNHMNPAFSYVDPSKVASLETVAGITSVGDGGDSIAGSIIVKSRPLEFRKGYKKLNLTSSYKSNNENKGAALNLAVANAKTSFSYSGLDESANNYRTGTGGRLKGTLYNQNNQSITIGRKIGDGVLSLKGGRSVIPYQGFVNQYMDMTDNVSNSFNLRYEGQIGETFLESSIFHQHTNHLMDMIRSQRDGEMPMYTRSDESGYNVKASFDLGKVHSLRVGSDFVRYRLDDWWPPVAGSMMMGPGTFANINRGRRDRLGIFAEATSEWTRDLKTNVGLRTDYVSMNTGRVQGYNNTNNLPVDAAAFNSSSRIHHDKNFDATLMTEWKATSVLDLEMGLSRKTRSPNLYERYAWAGSVSNPSMGAAGMDMSMINWFGDGNGYVGNLDLKPEVAHTLSTSVILHDENSKGWRVKLVPYFTRVENFIDADFIARSTMNGNNFLRFANHDADIFGFDASGSLALGPFTFKLIGNYTRGYRRDSKANLYNLKPLNGTLMVQHERGKWVSDLSVQAVKSKETVNNLRLEERTAGFALLNLGIAYRVTSLIKADLGVSNVFDHEYNLPLGGIDLVNTDTGVRQAVLGMGRSINTSVSIDFF